MTAKLATARAAARQRAAHAPVYGAPVEIRRACCVTTLLPEVSCGIAWAEELNELRRQMVALVPPGFRGVFLERLPDKDSDLSEFLLTDYIDAPAGAAEHAVARLHPSQRATELVAALRALVTDVEGVLVRHASLPVWAEASPIPRADGTAQPSSKGEP